MICFILWRKVFFQKYIGVGDRGTGLSRSGVETFEDIGWFRGEWKKQLASFLSYLGEGQLRPNRGRRPWKLTWPGGANSGLNKNEELILLGKVVVCKENQNSDTMTQGHLIDALVSRKVSGTVF